MRFAWAARLVLCFLLFTTSLRAQQVVLPQVSSPPPWISNSNGSAGPPWVPHPIRDADAVKVVQASINAMGGAPAIGQAQNCIIRAYVQQSSEPNKPNDTVVWTISGSEFRSDLSTTQGIETMATGHGKPFHSAQGRTLNLPAHVTRALFPAPAVAQVLLRALQDNTRSLEYRGTSTIESVPVNVVGTASQASRLDASITQQTWYFDNATGLPVRVEYSVPGAQILTRSAKSALNFSNFQAMSGVLYPAHTIKMDK